MKRYYDLHIHTALSPCADILMSPLNILNMAMLKGLSVIAITDHNSCLQLPLFEALQDSYNMLIIPGVEVSVQEGYHVVCYFRSFADAACFQQVLEVELTNEPHDEIYYGEQQLFDINDDIVQNYSISLVPHTHFTVDTLRKVITRLKGIMILAHIEKYQDSILEKWNKAYGDIFDGVEVNLKTAMTKVSLGNYRGPILRNSDAHQIVDIAEAEHFMELAECSMQCFFQFFKK